MEREYLGTMMYKLFTPLHVPENLILSNEYFLADLFDHLANAIYI